MIEVDSPIRDYGKAAGQAMWRRVRAAVAAGGSPRDIGGMMPLMPPFGDAEAWDHWLRCTRAWVHFGGEDVEGVIDKAVRVRLMVAAMAPLPPESR